ncbi:MAG: hypothetical protein ACXABG_12175 [Promethearchaeota archaeon]|jgi:hypothetical protein
MSEFSEIDTENLIDRKIFRKKHRDFMSVNGNLLMEIMTINRENKISFGHIIERNAEQWPDKAAEWIFGSPDGAELK